MKEEKPDPRAKGKLRVISTAPPPPQRTEREKDDELQLRELIKSLARKRSESKTSEDEFSPPEAA